MDTRSTAEYHQIEQRVATQTVGTVYRYASHFAYSEQTVDDLVVAVGILSDGLTMNIGRHAAHHVVAGRNHWNWSNNRIDVSEGLGQFANAWQAAVQHFFTKVIKLEQYVVLVRAATVAGEYFFNH